MYAYMAVSPHTLLYMCRSFVCNLLHVAITVESMYTGLHLKLKFGGGGVSKTIDLFYIASLEIFCKDYVKQSVLSFCHLSVVCLSVVGIYK